MLEKPPNAEPEPNGQPAAREPQAANPAASAATPDTGQPGAPLPALCARCGAEVPEAVGRCPGCGTFQKDNVESVVHGLRSKKLAKVVDAYRVELIDQLFAERGGRAALDVVSRIAIENYALVCAQHKTIEARLDQDGPFTQTGRRRSAFDMLKAISETIDRLRAELPPILTRSTSLSGVDAMPMSALELARDLLKRQIAGDTLTERELGHLDVLHSAMRGAVVLPPDPPPPNIDLPVAAGRPVLAEAEPREARPEPTPAPAPEPTCEFCHQTLTRCAEIKATRIDVWEVLHGLDPEVVKKKDEQATAEMLESMRRQRRGIGPQW